MIDTNSKNILFKCNQLLLNILNIFIYYIIVKTVSYFINW